MRGGFGDINQNSDRDQINGQRRTAVTDERQRNTGDREEADVDTDVNERLEEDEYDDPHGDGAAEAVSRGAGHPDTAAEEEDEENEQEHRADEAELLAQDAEDVVGCGGLQEV